MTQRSLRPQVARCVGYEFERVIARVSDAHWAQIQSGRLGRPGEVAVNRLNRRWAAASRIPAPMARRDPPGRFDVAVAVMQLPSDLVTLSSVRQWRERSDRAVCFIEEIWTVELDRWKGHLRLLDQFDHVFVGSHGTVEALSERIASPVSYLPYSVDADLFAPPTLDEHRWIGVCNIGRRSEVTHAALMDWSRSTRGFYYHDSFRPGPVKDPAEHRELLARVLQATDVAITCRGVGSRAHETGHQQELGFRYFEASASGALMVGQPPPHDAVVELFDWPDAIIRAPFDAPDIADLLADLAADPARVARARRANVVNALRRHDHVHRWQTMLDAVGVASGGLVARRLDLLGRRADGFDRAS